jgi:D-3-phosphoglycerate dehydrogenase
VVPGLLLRGGVSWSVLITDPVVPEAVALLESEPGVKVDVRLGLPAPELVQAIPTFDALIVRSGTQVTREVIEAGTKLKVIARAGTGVDNVDVEAATRRGVLVMNAPSGNTIAAAEHTLSLMLALARAIPAADRSVKAGEWQRGRFLGVELLGKTLGILGYGRIGREVARRAAAFGMRILVHDPFVVSEPGEKGGVEFRALPDVLAEADFVSLHVPFTSATRHLIDEAALARLKPGARLVNVSRGGIVDEAALLRALASGRLAGAALDVFEQEPPAAADPLIQRADVVATPHLGASTREAQELVAITVAEQLLDVLRGRPARNAVNLPTLTPEMGERVRPFLYLAERVGTMQAELVQGPPRGLQVRFAGEVAELDTAMIALGLFKGLLAPSLGDRVNYVNCRTILKERRVAVDLTSADDAGEFASVIEARVESEGDTHTVGATFRRDGSFRLTQVDGYRLDASLAGSLIVLKNLDVPGVIGRIGSILGDHRVNISHMTWGRRGERGEDALTVIGIDAPVPAPGLAALAAEPTVVWVRAVTLPGAARAD